MSSILKFYFIFFSLSLSLTLFIPLSSYSAVSEGVLTDNPHLVLLFYLAQRFLHELIKSYRLIQVVPMDMSGYYGKWLREYDTIHKQITRTHTNSVW